MIDLDTYIDSIIFGSIKNSKLIDIRTLPIEEQFLINITTTRNIKRIPSLSFCFTVEVRLQELISEGELYLSNTEVFDNLVKYFRKFPPNVYKPCLMFMVRTMFTGLRMRISPHHSLHWRWFSKELHNQISGSGATFGRIDLLRNYYRYVPLSERKQKIGVFLQQRTIAQGIRKTIINPPKASGPLIGHPLFRKKS